MSWLKRLFLITTAAILFATAAVPAYAAKSPTKEEYYTVTTDDGYTVILWKMPDYLYKLSEKGQRKYQKFLPLEEGEVLYLGEVPAGKHAGSMLSILEENNIDSIPVASAVYQLEKPHGVFLMSSVLGIKVADIMEQAAVKIADSGAQGTSAATVKAMRAELRAAYADIKRMEHRIAELNPKIKDKAAAAGVPLGECEVTQLFDLTALTSSEELEKYDGMGTLTISVVGKSIGTEVCLLHRHNAVWEVVEDARMVNGVLVFTTDTCSPFAVVTWNNAGIGTGAKQSPKTGDNTYAWIGVVAVTAVVISAAAYVLISAARKKRL